MLPINDRSCFNFLGCSSFIMASVFVINGFVHWGVILKPSHLIMYLANLYFCRFIARFYLSNLSSILSNSFSCSLKDPLVITRISCKHANCFWKRCRHIREYINTVYEPICSCSTASQNTKVTMFGY